MKLLICLLFMFIIIAPFYYFHHIFYHHSHLKITLTIMTIFSSIIMIIKICIQPYSSFFFLLTSIVQFYILILFITFLLSIICKSILTLLHKPMSHRYIIILTIFSLLYTSFGYISHFHRIKTHYEITIHKDSDIKQMKIAMISDIHLGSGTDNQDLKHLSKQLKNYDIICLCGDIFDESTPPVMIEEAISILSKANPHYGIYAVEGNHELYSKINMSDFYKKYNIHFLQDDYACIDNKVNIVGRKDVYHSSLTSQELFKDIDSSLPTIVLDHNPKRYKEVLDYADLQLSGHTHAGQSFPITSIINLFFDNAYGLMQQNDFSLIVSSGYGSWGFPVRTLANCEFVDIMVTF